MIRILIPDGEADAARATLAMIALALLARLALALAIGLGTDEAYTVAVSRQLALSYFDHPPLHQWITHAAAGWLGEGRLARLPFIMLFAATSWLVFLLTRRLYGALAGWWAVVALNLAAFFTLSAGSWIVPDGALLFGLALAAYAMACALFPQPGEPKRPWLFWLLAGLGLGLAGLAKYHAALVALGAVAFLLATQRGRAALAHPAPWVAGVLTLTLVSPVLIWNARNGYASFLFQAGRSQGDGFAPWLAPASLAAQAGWLLPWVFAALVLGLSHGWRKQRDERFGFLLALALPTIALFTLLPMFGNLGLPHWAMPGWFLLMPLAGLALADAMRARRWPWLLPVTGRLAAGSALVLALLATQAGTAWLTRLVPAVSRADPTLELAEWSALPVALERALASTGRSLAADAIIIADSWHTAGRIDLAMGGRHVVLPGSADPRHYAFIVDQRPLVGRSGVVIVRARREALLREALTPQASLGASIPLAVGRSGLPEIPLVAIPFEAFAKPVAWPYGLAR
jgi:4-amino-4-deoxy-L-arabinose transferase-like glycosyltransferase